MGVGSFPKSTHQVMFTTWRGRKRDDGRGIVLCEEELVLSSPFRFSANLHKQLKSPKQAAEVNAKFSKGHDQACLFQSETPFPSSWPLAAGLSQLNSNHPVEDRSVITVLKKTRHLLGLVVDGHSGWQTSEYVAKRLAHKIEKYFNQLSSNPSDAEIHEAMKNAFLQVDEDLRKIIDPLYRMGFSKAAIAGATTVCCIVTDKKLIVANVGDSKAVLCRSGVAHELTVEHNARVPSEEAKLRLAHPNEDDVVEVIESKADVVKRPWLVENPNPFWRMLSTLGMGDFRVPREEPKPAYTKGRLQLTRAFGDFHLKDEKYCIDHQAGVMLVKAPHSFPYLSAEPDVKVLDRQDGGDQFLILASDGLWDEVSPQEACDIVRCELRKKDSTISDASKRLHDEVLKRVAFKQEMDMEAVKKLPPKKRRDLIDDQSIVIIRLTN